MPENTKNRPKLGGYQIISQPRVSASNQVNYYKVEEDHKEPIIPVAPPFTRNVKSYL